MHVEERTRAALAAREPHLPPLGMATFADPDVRRRMPTATAQPDRLLTTAATKTATLADLHDPLRNRNDAGL